MTPDERTMAFALSRCSFVPGIGTKRFARDMASRAQAEESGRIENRPLSEKQGKYLREAVWRYRRQIPDGIVYLASREDPVIF